MLLALVGEEFSSGQGQARGDDPLDAGDTVRVGVSVLCVAPVPSGEGTGSGDCAKQQRRGHDQPLSQPPGQGCPSTRSHTLGPWSKVGKKQAGQAGSWVRVGQAGLGVSEEDDSALFLWPDGERLWHIRGRPRGFCVSSLFPWGIRPGVSWSPVTASSGSFLHWSPTVPEHLV